jgi:hypothetical protein
LTQVEKIRLSVKIERITLIMEIDLCDFRMTPLRSNISNINLGSLKATSAVLGQFPVPVESPFSELQEFFFHLQINREFHNVTTNLYFK